MTVPGEKHIFFCPVSQKINCFLDTGKTKSSQININILGFLHFMQDSIIVKFNYVILIFTVSFGFLECPPYFSILLLKNVEPFNILSCIVNTYNKSWDTLNYVIIRPDNVEDIPKCILFTFGYYVSYFLHTYNIQNFF